MRVIGQVIMWISLFGGIALAAYGKHQQVKLARHLFSSGIGSFWMWRKRVRRGEQPDPIASELYRKYVRFYSFGISAVFLVSVLGFIFSWASIAGRN